MLYIVFLVISMTGFEMDGLSHFNMPFEVPLGGGEHKNCITNQTIHILFNRSPEGIKYEPTPIFIFYIYFNTKTICNAVMC